MKLQEAVKVYQECHNDKPKDCDTCLINQRKVSHEITICNHLAMAEELASKIEPECQQVDCQHRSNDTCGVDCVEGHLYQSPDKYEVVGER